MMVGEERFFSIKKEKRRSEVVPRKARPFVLMQNGRKAFYFNQGARMDTKMVIQSQYLAALAMLEQAVLKCPQELWTARDDKNKFWHIAYHSLFYTHLYLQDKESDFRPWENHRDEYQYLGPLPLPPHDLPKIGEAYSKENVLAYLAFVQTQVRERVPALELDGPSGFDWLPLGKLELQLYTIRHLQQHNGELYERLGRAGIDLPWIDSAE
jgi:hypothetical protein